MRDITTDEELVEVVDELVHRLKPIHTELGLKFRRVVQGFIHDNHLDSDQHNFATLPPKRPTSDEPYL